MAFAADEQAVETVKQGPRQSKWRCKATLVAFICWRLYTKASAQSWLRVWANKAASLALSPEVDVPMTMPNRCLGMPAITAFKRVCMALTKARATATLREARSSSSGGTAGKSAWIWPNQVGRLPVSQVWLRLKWLASLHKACCKSAALLPKLDKACQAATPTGKAVMASPLGRYRLILHLRPRDLSAFDSLLACCLSAMRHRPVSEIPTGFAYYCAIFCAQAWR